MRRNATRVERRFLLARLERSWPEEKTRGEEDGLALAEGLPETESSEYGYEFTMVLCNSSIPRSLAGCCTIFSYGHPLFSTPLSALSHSLSSVSKVLQLARFLSACTGIYIYIYMFRVLSFPLLSLSLSLSLSSIWLHPLHGTCRERH